MRIRIITTFTDLQATDPEKTEVSAGSEITVTAERGAQLIDLGLAEEVEPKRTRKPAVPSKPAASPSTAAGDADHATDPDASAPTT